MRFLPLSEPMSTPRHCEWRAKSVVVISYWRQRKPPSFHCDAPIMKAHVPVPPASPMVSVPEKHVLGRDRSLPAIERTAEPIRHTVE